MSLFRKKGLVSLTAEAAHDSHGRSLNKVLNVRDLTFLGVAAVVGAGIFSTIGAAAAEGGPGISILFIITAVTCGFSALCYAEFASRIPLSGSAYTYAYVSFGELIAWIIGWALILEYAVGNIMVAISWSSYLDNLLRGIGIEIPYWLKTNSFDASAAIASAQAAVASGASLDPVQQAALNGYDSAPVIGGKRLFMNLPAFLIVAFITSLVYKGIQESKKSANAMVIFKVAVIIFVIIIGFFFINPENWNPFMPNGFDGVLKGVGAVFYAYIGFDAISTTAEEAKNPQRDLPRGMMYSLLICTVLYIAIALTLTGMVHYSKLNVADPLAYVFEVLGMNWIGYIISVSAVIATTSVLLVFQLGQPRIWMTMSRDGLLPKKFSEIHPRYKTPAFATILAGLLVAIPALFMPGNLVTDLTSIGTLFAFIIVCLGVLTLPRINKEKGKFKLPYINGQFLVPALVAVFLFFNWDRFMNSLGHLDEESINMKFVVYIVVAIGIAVATFLRRYSAIPIIGALSCLYLMLEISNESWLYFLFWMALGLSIYFLYSRSHSQLANKTLK